MKTKAKKFSKKLLALFLAVLMAVSCFAGTITSYGAVAKSSSMTYHDAEVMYNELGWTMLSDEQVATAILDYADSMLEDLAKMEPQLAARVTNLKVPTINILWNVSNHKISIRLGSLSLISVTVDIGSVNGLIKTLGNVHDALHGTMASIAGVAVDLGDLKKVNLNSMNGMSRENNTSTEILRGVFKLIYDNQYALNRLFQGTLTLGTLNGALDIYGLIGGIADAPSGYQSNMIYNLVQSLIFKFTNWYTNDEKIAFRGGRPAGTTDADGNTLPEIPAQDFIFDYQLLDKMTTELLANISVLVTYNQQYDKLATDENGNLIKKVDKDGKADGYEYNTDLDNSATRYLKIKEYMTANTCNYATAAAALGYDPNICYSDEFVDKDGNYLNVLLFAYGSPDENGLATDKTKTIALTTADSLFEFGYQALNFAWKTVLKDTVKLLHVNYDVNRGHGSNFDNEFYYYLDSNGLWTGDATKDYTMANLKAYAKHLAWTDVKDADGNIVMDGEYAKKEQVPLYQVYGITVDPANVNAEKNIVATEDEAVELFISWIRNNYEYDRDVTEGSTGKWSDIDATTITNKVRYSPIADKIFNMPTGPINLYFMQLGTPNLDAFFADANYANYPSMVAALNDALVAAVKDIFVESDNVYGTVPTLSTIGSGESFNTIGASQIESITSTLINNALDVVQYTADAIDRNILKAFYDNGGTELSEANIETAMLPLLIACIGQVNLDGKLCELIHPRDWDACKDAEGIVFLALEEYLSYVLPDYDYRQLITYDDQGKINASLENTVLPMARDAVAYVMEGYVPVYDGDGNMYKVENKKPGDAGYYVNGYASGTYNKAGANDLFTLLNSVVCYYADKKTVTANGNDKGFTNGVANLLGVIEGDGTSKVNINNDLFTNINNIANRLLPVVGTLQGKGYGAVDSYDLIWNKIVKGILDIGPNSGVTNFINQLLTIVSAEPIQTTSITLTVYDVLKDLLNALFGPRYTGQGWVPVPDRTTDHPFDDVLQKAVVAGTGDSSPGTIQKAIYNLIEFSGVGSGGIATYPDTLLPGATFAVLSVNNLLHFIPFLDTASINQADAKFVEGYTKSGVAASGTYIDEFIFTNKCSGINSVVINKDGSITQNSRYAAKITAVNTSVDSTASGLGATVSLGTNWVGQVVQPDAKLTQNVTFKAPSSGEAFYSVEVVYDVVEVNNTAKVVVANQKTTGYKYITGEISWIDTVYPSVNSFNKTYDRVGDGGYWYATALEGGYSSGKQGVKTLNGFSMNDAKGIGNNAKVICRTPNEIVIDKSNPGMISSLGMLVRNEASWLQGKRTIHGIFTYQEGVQMINDLSGNTTTVIGTSNYNQGTPLFDRTTGDIIKMGRYDYSLDEGLTWTRSDANHADGFLYQEIESKLGHTNFITRPHVVFTLQEAQTAKILKAAHKNTETNLWEYVFLDATQSGASYTYEALCTKVSWATPIDGIYVDSFSTTDIDYGKGIYVNVLFYDGVTPLEAGKVDQKLGLHFWNQTAYGNEAGYNNVQLYVADDASKPGLQSGIEALTDCLDYYGVEDFDASLGGETVYNNAKAQLKDALKTYSIQYSSTFLNGSGLDTIADTNIELPVTSETTSTTGDLAYKPFTTSNDSELPSEIKADAFVKSNGVYYLDKNYTMPIYTNSPLTDADVTGGKDAAGYAVEKGEDGKWYLTNYDAYEQTWQKPVSGTYVHKYPVRVDLSVQKENDNAELIYKQIQFEYRNIYSNKVNSDMQWICKFPVSQTVLTPATRTSLQTVDYRGVYTQHRDNLDYYNEQLGEVRDTYAAESLFSGITQTRTGLVQNNFDIVSFYRMQNAAQLVERNFSVYIWHDDLNELGETEEIEEILSPTDAVSRMKYYDDQGIAYTYETDSRAVKYAMVDYYQNYFNQYYDKLVDRSYIGDKVEAEIICTTGTDYSNIEVVSPAVIGPSLDAEGNPALNSNGNPIVDKNGNPLTDWEGKAIDVIITPAVVKIKNTSGVTVPYGALDTNGNLVNEGEKVYTDYTWNIFVTDIANAVTVAQRGNNASYPAAGEYYAPATYTYDAEVSTCYTEYKDLRRAEITLIEDIPVGGYNVTASLVVAKDGNGATDGIAVNGDYTITLTDATDTVIAETVFASAAGANTFTLAGVPNGTYTMTITSAYSLPRTATVVVNGADVTAAEDIAIIACDFDQSGAISALDLVMVYGEIAGSGNLVCDLDGSGAISALDLVPIYSCIATGDKLPAVTIQ